MERLSKEYGWTPNQIRDLPVEEVQAYMDIISIRAKREQAEARKRKK